MTLCEFQLTSFACEPVADGLPERIGVTAIRVDHDDEAVLVHDVVFEACADHHDGALGRDGAGCPAHLDDGVFGHVFETLRHVVVAVEEHEDLRDGVLGLEDDPILTYLHLLGALLET